MLLKDYIRNGIIQLGRFQQPDGSFYPISANFLLLPSYPDLMRRTVQQLLPLVRKTGANRLLTTRAAIPLGALLSAESDLPLTYPYGEEHYHTAAYTIEGAFDVGHPTTLLTYLLPDPDVESLITMAGKVGLQVREVISVMSFGHDTRAMLNLIDSLPQLVEAGMITSHMQGVLEKTFPHE